MVTQAEGVGIRIWVNMRTCRFALHSQDGGEDQISAYSLNMRDPNMLYIPDKITRGSLGETRSQGRCQDTFVVHPSVTDCVFLYVPVESCCSIKVKNAFYGQHVQHSKKNRVGYNSDSLILVSTDFNY